MSPLHATAVPPRPYQPYLRRIAEEGRPRAYGSKYQRRFPEIEEAYFVLQQARRLGWVKRQACEVCGEMKTEAHHDDYTKPLAVRWLCATHHRRLHPRRKRLAVAMKLELP